MNLPTHDDVLRAYDRLSGRIVRTPMLRSPVLDRELGATALLKPEPLQRTGSFKLRGATNAILMMSEAQRQAGVVTYSSGNHGQAVACAAASLGVAATVFMPSDAPRIKAESTAAWGARVEFYDRRRDDRVALGHAFAERTGATVVPPFDDPNVIAGQGTAALELIADARIAGLQLDALLVPTGGGGLIAGSALAAEGFSPGAQIYAVEPEGWDDTARSLAAGARMRNAGDGSMLCDALLAEAPGAITFAVNRYLLAGAFSVSDAEALQAMAFAFRNLKVVVEPGGAVALAALLARKFDVRGKVVGVVLSGGNVDPAVFVRALGEAQS